MYFLYIFNFNNYLTISLVNESLDINSKDSVKVGKAYSFMILSTILKIITMKVTEILKVATYGASTLLIVSGFSRNTFYRHGACET